MAYSFRCRHCGFLESSAHAGECHVPHACRVCGRGVVFARDLDDALAHPHAAHARVAAPKHELARPHRQGGRVVALPYGIKFLHHENWEDLSLAVPERLAELGLTAADVTRHVPHGAAPGRPPRDLAVAASEGTQLSDDPSA